MLAAILFAAAITVVSAQEEEDEDELPPGNVPIESDWSGAGSLYSRGDQTFSINLGLVKPLFFVDQEQGYLDTQMKLGGMGSLAYSYFLSPRFFIGGELNGMFASTAGKSMYFIVPIGFRAGYQFVFRRFEFPLAMMIGFAPQSHKQRSYFGFFAKPSAAAFFRFNANWSFGLNSSLWWAPEWTGKTRENHGGAVNIHGFFWELSIGARYHF